MIVLILMFTTTAVDVRAMIHHAATHDWRCVLFAVAVTLFAITVTVALASETK